MIFYYIRHGDPIYDPDSLTELGHKQAEALSKRFKLTGLDEVYASTSMRARMTAEPTCKALGLEMTLLDWANEGHIFDKLSVPIPDGSGKRRWIFHDRPSIEKMWSPEARALGMEWYKHPHFAGTNIEASMDSMRDSADEFLASLGFEHDRENSRYRVTKKNGKRVALFAHEGCGKAFLSSVLDLPYSYVATRFELTHSAVTVLYFGEDEEFAYPKMLQWANDSHLYKEEILTPFNHWLSI